MFSGKTSMRIESFAAGLGRAWVAGTSSIVDDISTRSAGECRFNETGVALRSGADAVDCMLPLVATSVTGAPEVETFSLTLKSPLKSRDNRCLNPDVDERSEVTDLVSLKALGPWPSYVASSLAVQ